MNDRLGTPEALIDENEQVVWEAFYKPFGEADVHPESSITNNLRFPGQYFDSETGLHYNYHRYYDPGTGRYLTTDPIGLDGGINLYAYVGGNPVNFVDLLGLARIKYRPLGTLGGGWYSQLQDETNTIIAHQQIIFDKPVKINGKEVTNIGFFEDGIGPDTQPISRYTDRNQSELLNDDILKRAVELTPNRKPYSLLDLFNLSDNKYNCQDWIDDVLRKYQELLKEETNCE